MIRAIIFDLDDTLVNTRAIEKLRMERRWKECVQNANLTELYPGMWELLNKLNERDIGVGIVTASVSFYANSLLRYHGVQKVSLVAYHDAKPRKPHPAPVQKCLETLGKSSKDVLAVGDSAIDDQAYRSAGCYSVGAGWNRHLEVAEWNYVAQTPMELLDLPE